MYVYEVWQTRRGWLTLGDVCWMRSELPSVMRCRAATGLDGLDRRSNSQGRRRPRPQTQTQPQGPPASLLEG